MGSRIQSWLPIAPAKCAMRFRGDDQVERIEGRCQRRQGPVIARSVEQRDFRRQKADLFGRRALLERDKLDACHADQGKKRIESHRPLPIGLVTRVPCPRQADAQQVLVRDSEACGEFLGRGRRRDTARPRGHGFDFSFKDGGKVSSGHTEAKSASRRAKPRYISEAGPHNCHGPN